MSGRRRIGRFAAWLALAATLLSGIPPAGVHGRLIDRLDGHSDFCSASGAIPPAPASPDPAGHDSRACAHCDGCTGNAGSHWAPLPASPQLAEPVASNAAVAGLRSPSIRSADLIAAPAR